jgi:hypothetical protein
MVGAQSQGSCKPQHSSFLETIGNTVLRALYHQRIYEKNGCSLVCALKDPVISKTYE